MRPRAKILAATLVLGLASGLAACEPVTFSSAEAVSIVGTDKTLLDHVISLSSGKECATIRKERGLTYCVEDTPQVRQNVYCYRTLGNVTCYDRADPHRNGHARVDRNDHNLPN